MHSNFVSVMLIRPCLEGAAATGAVPHTVCAGYALPRCLTIDSLAMLP
jgi:hypothetical protein